MLGCIDTHPRLLFFLLLPPAMVFIRFLTTTVFALCLLYMSVLLYLSPYVGPFITVFVRVLYCTPNYSLFRNCDPHSMLQPPVFCIDPIPLLNNHDFTEWKKYYQQHNF